MRSNDRPATVVVPGPLQTPPTASVPLQPVSGAISPNGSANWIVLRPSQVPPAIEGAVLVGAPRSSTMLAVGTAVHAPSAASITASLAAAPRDGSAFATR